MMHLPAAWTNPRSAQPQQRLWTRWWWLGSAITEKDITLELTALRNAGFGGVEISPIYAPDTPGYTSADYLSPLFVQRFRHAVRTARANNMGVDCILGTGWPYGGPWIDKTHRAFGLSIVPARQSSRPDGATVITQTGDLVALAIPTCQQVKRSGPGGAGNVVDPFSREATEVFLKPLSDFFNKLGPDTPRAIFNDSWEVYGANTTLGVAASFEKSTGYPLPEALAALVARPLSSNAQSQRSDYAAHIEALTHTEFLTPWAMFAHSHRAKTRLQAHGSPGNLIDFYAAADIPEAEQFGCGPLVLSGREPLVAIPKPVSHEVAVEEMFICTLAASAAQLTGKPLISAEAFTWLGEHGAAPLDHIRAEVDELFLAGVNHIFCHGTAASPADAPWPGWMFYASNHFGPTNPWFAHIKPLTDYVARAQSLLQGSTFDGDALVYFPIWDDRGNVDRASPVMTYTLHGTADWLRSGMPGLSTLLQQWFRDGSQISMFSDSLIEQVKIGKNGQLTSNGSTWKCIVIPECTTMPYSTLSYLCKLATAGAHVIFIGNPPSMVPGFPKRDIRQAAFNKLWSDIRTAPSLTTSTRAKSFRLGSGRVTLASDWSAARATGGWIKEPSATATLGVRRIRLESTRVHFLVNRANGTHQSHITVAHTGPRPRTATILDPRSGSKFIAPVVSYTATSVSLLADLPADSVRFVVWDNPKMPPPTGVAGIMRERDLEIGLWDVTPVHGSVRPETKRSTSLGDWCDWSATWRAFSGRAVYKASVAATPGRRITINLGEVRYSARILWNGREISTLISAPYSLTIGGSAVKSANILEVEVANLMLNGLIGCEKSGVKWQKFYFVGIDYKPFTATSHKELPSGLLGPVVIRQEL
ncbi:MAG: glycosyl hydrolase [Armatimonadota bacterium]